MDSIVPPAHVGSLHQQVGQDLLRRIGTQYQPGDMLPSEASLCAEYGVSRITIRSAVARLVDRGLLVRKRGVGTFVTGRPNASRSFNLVGFLDEIKAHTYRLLIDESVPATPQVASKLGIEAGVAVRHMRNVVHRDNEPLTVSDSFTLDSPEYRISAEDLGAGLTSTQAMAKRLGRRIERAEQTIDAVVADSHIMSHLDLEPGTPIIRARRVYFAPHDEPVQYLEVRYHPYRYNFNVDLVPRGETSAFTHFGTTALV